MIGFDPLEQLPTEWTCVAQRVPGQTRGPDGNMLPGQAPHDVEGFLIAPTGVGETAEFASYSTNRTRGYAPARYEFTDKDVIITPASSVMPGRWAVDGTPIRWPFGWELQLKSVRQT